MGKEQVTGDKSVVHIRTSKRTRERERKCTSTRAGGTWHGKWEYEISESGERDTSIERIVSMSVLIKENKCQIKHVR